MAEQHAQPKQFKKAQSLCFVYFLNKSFAAVQTSQKTF